MDGLSVAIVAWHCMQVEVSGKVISLPGSGLLWHCLHGRLNARCCLWLYGIGCSCAGCGLGLSGTICLAACWAPAIPHRPSSTARTGTTTFEALFLALRIMASPHRKNKIVQ